jgi:hypothetical protein
MARERCRTGMCEQRGPTEDAFKKCRRHPQGYSPANNRKNKRFRYFCAFQK